MKSVIKRNLPLDISYTVVDKKYIPLENGIGCTCDNCGKLIANIATVKDENNNSYNIGFDCLETILINNQLLSSTDIDDYVVVKKMIPKIIRFSKTLKELDQLNNGLKGFIFERPCELFKDDGWITYYLVKTGKPYNTVVKLKGVDFDFLVKTITAILPNHEITIRS